MDTEGSKEGRTTSEMRALHSIADRLAMVRAELTTAETRLANRLTAVHPSHRQSALNLLHYLAFRRHDLRPLQEDLASIGLSSLGRNEASVAFSIDALLKLLHGLIGVPMPTASTGIAPPTYTEGRALLEGNTCRLLGETPAERSVRIMVTMPTEAAFDYMFVRSLVESGMDCMRVNCAHDGPTEWGQMVAHLRRAEEETGRQCRLLMDLAGPKLRTGHIREEEPEAGVLRLFKGDHLLLTREPLPGQIAQRDREGHIVRPAQIACQLPEVFSSIQPGERV